MSLRKDVQSSAPKSEDSDEENCECGRKEINKQNNLLDKQTQTLFSSQATESSAAMEVSVEFDVATLGNELQFDEYENLNDKIQTQQNGGDDSDQESQEFEILSNRSNDLSKNDQLNSKLERIVETQRMIASKMNELQSLINQQSETISAIDISNIGVKVQPSKSPELVSNSEQFGTYQQQPIPKYNILFLGETGAGKSTTINAIANYLKFASFEDAIGADEFVELIPSRFTLPHPETGEPFVIRSGLDGTDDGVDGDSHTKTLEHYSFALTDRIVTIIDTPGMGDTRGVAFDRENFEKILTQLTHFKELHAICVLIKSTETRKTAFFRYCLTELLAKLPKSICANIMFCFTFGRNSYFGPGEGYANLRAFLREDLKEMSIELKSGLNCFYIDNESYRFLVAKQQGYPFGEYQQSLYMESWDQSVKQTQMMIQQIACSQPFVHSMELTD